MNFTKRVYRTAEIEAALEACPDTPRGHRDRLAVMLLWSTGLKSAELVAMKSRDWGDGTSIRSGARLIRIPIGQQERLAECVGTWLDHRAGCTPTRSSPFLCTLRGETLDTSYIRHMLAELSSTVGLERRLHAQGLRNTCAASLYYGGVPLVAILEQLGVTDPNSALAAVAAAAGPGRSRDPAIAAFELE